jgi:hypothetical protein
VRDANQVAHRFRRINSGSILNSVVKSPIEIRAHISSSRQCEYHAKVATSGQRGMFSRKSNTLPCSGSRARLHKA